MTGGRGDTGIPHGALLIEFAEAVLSSDQSRLAEARRKLLDTLGAEALVDACGVVGFFNGIDRVADATGTALDDKTLADSEALREELGINRFQKPGSEHLP